MIPTPNSPAAGEQEGVLTPDGVLPRVGSSPDESSSPLARSVGLFSSQLPPSPSADEKAAEKNLAQRVGRWLAAHKYHLLAGAAGVAGGALVAVILRMRSDIKHNRSSIAEVRNDLSHLTRQLESQSVQSPGATSMGARQWP